MKRLSMRNINVTETMLNDYRPTSTTCKALRNTFNASIVAVLASTSTAKLLQSIKHQHYMHTVSSNEREIKEHNKVRKSQPEK